jgi:three-Cys-motif partner protein
MAAPFFDESKDQSIIKAAIVRKYFIAWARVIVRPVKARGGNIAYIDLFAGPGRYKDGSKSTPLLVLEAAINDPDLRNMLITLFNDVDADHSRSLEEAISSLSGIETLKHTPRVYNYEVGDEIVKTFESMRLVPTLFFVDPWGYKGLSLRLINSVIRNWGCDCIFFFNYNRINMGINNSFVKDHMAALFGEDRASFLREKLRPLSTHERELTIVEEISTALKMMGGTYVLPFIFKRPGEGRTSHHLIFVSKNIRGYEIMKDIMARESSHTDQGVPSFEYNTATRDQTLLFSLSQPLNALEDMLLADFAGQTLTMKEIYDKHHVDRPYIKGNYKDVLKNLEDKKSITATPSKRRAGTFGDNVMVTFPALS